MAYKAPIWEDGKSPAISAENLNNLSQAAEGAQVLYGNSAPTSSTEGAVGQFYLVVVADSDGNYPLYQCVAIANGSYVWRDTRRIPDSITSMLGIPAPGTINSALNVLAHVGNLHVWERVQSGVTDYLTSTDRNAYPDNVTDAQDAYYSLGDVVSGNIINSAGSVSVGFYYSDTISVDSEGNIIIPTTNTISLYNYKTTNTDTIKGKFIKLYTSNGDIVPFSGVIYIPSDSAFSINSGLYCSAYQPVTGHAAIPANNTITYLGQLGGGAKIEVGSYVGTGTYGKSNPNSLTFGFEPKLIVIDAGNWATNSTPSWPVIGVKNHPYLYRDINYESRKNLITWLENGVEFYSDGGATYQLNESGATYYYIAIG